MKYLTDHHKYKFEIELYTRETGTRGTLADKSKELVYSIILQGIDEKVKEFIKFNILEIIFNGHKMYEIPHDRIELLKTREISFLVEDIASISEMETINKKLSEAGIVTVGDFLDKSKEEIIGIISEEGYEDLRYSFSRKGIYLEGQK